MPAHFETLAAKLSAGSHLGFRTAASVLALVAGTMAAYGQEIVLDRPVHAGELTLFPSVRNSQGRHDYYYAADRAELAVDEQGRPRFSFLQYVDSLAGSDDESEGGGVVHALVQLSVDEDLVGDAQRALTQIDGEGVIVGPVNFRSGTFALISSFAQADGSFTDAVMGVGKSPLLQNEMAAVSLRLTREGAEVLRGSLESPTPDLSFSFEMEMDGYRSPKEAVLEADFERVYSHDTFAAGIATPYLQAEIEAAFEDLRREGAIRLTEIGDDEEMGQLVQAAYTKLIEIMFEKAPSTGTDALAQLQGSVGGGQTSLLDRAATMLSNGRQEARQSNEGLAQRNSQQATQNAAAAESASKAAELKRQHAEAQNRAENARRLQREAEVRLAAEEKAQTTLPDLTDDEKAALRTRIEAARRAVDTNRAAADEAEAAANALAPQVEQARTQSEQAQGAVRELEGPKEMPSLAIVASYKMKRSKMSGSFHINLNKYTAASQTLRFDRNLGDLRRHLDDVIQVVDVGDTAFRRREVGVILDGVNVEDFGDFVNSVTVLLEKEHEDGSATQRELAVNRENFNAEGADFALAYNRLGDEPASDFLTYRYEVLWNFFGGIEVAEPARLRRTSDITLSPPMSRRTIQIEADPQIVADEGIRAIMIRLFYNPGDRERTETVTLRPSSNGTGMSDTVEIVLPDERTDFEYEMEWIMRDGSRRPSGRIPSDQSLIFADLMPGADPMRRTLTPITALLALCIALPAPLLAQGTAAPPPTEVTFTEDEVDVIVVSRDNIHRTNDRLRAADLAIRVHIRGSMEAIMQGHTEGFAIFETWYRKRDARLREEAAQREVIANICGKALGLGLDFVIPGSGLFVKTLRTGLSTAYDQASKSIAAFDGGDPNMFIAEQRRAIEKIRSSYLAQADTIPNQQAQAVEEMKWEYLADAEARGDTSSGLSPHLRQIAAHYGIPEPNAQTIERTKLAVLEGHIRAVYEADKDQQFAARATSGFSTPEGYFTAISRTSAYRHAYAGQPDKYCPVELDMMGYGLMGAGQECRRWRTASRG